MELKNKKAAACVQNWIQSSHFQSEMPHNGHLSEAPKSQGELASQGAMKWDQTHDALYVFWSQEWKLYSWKVSEQAEM